MLSLSGLLLFIGAPAYGETLHAAMALATATGPGDAIGSITISQTPAGAVFHLDLHGLPPGQHGFHGHGWPSSAPGVKEGGHAPGRPGSPGM
jgi:Cu-Zn family superoxide dismutase